MKETTTYATTHQLRADYVTKFEFNEFRTEVRDQFIGVNARFDGIETRLDSIEKRQGIVEKRLDVLVRRMDTLEENVGKRIDGALDEFTHRLKVGIEYIAAIVEGKKTSADPLFF